MNLKNFLEAHINYASSSEPNQTGVQVVGTSPPFTKIVCWVRSGVPSWYLYGLQKRHFFCQKPFFGPVEPKVKPF